MRKFYGTNSKNVLILCYLVVRVHQYVPVEVQTVYLREFLTERLLTSRLYCLNVHKSRFIPSKYTGLSSKSVFTPFFCYLPTLDSNTEPDPYGRKASV